MIPTAGAVGVNGWGLTIIFPDAAEIHPDTGVTVKVYVPAASPVIAILAPVPVVEVPPGVLIKVHVPTEGRPVNVTPPVATEHVGWMIVPTTGGAGVDGVALMTTLDDDGDVQKEAFVTVKV